jgi:hypothetical protein
MTLTPEQPAEQALSNILGDEVRRFYAVRVTDALGSKITVDVIREEKLSQLLIEKVGQPRSGKGNALLGLLLGCILIGRG